MINQSEIEKWLTNNYDVKFIRSNFWSGNPVIVGTFLIEGIETLKNIFKEYEESYEGTITKISIYRNAIGNFIFSLIPNDKEGTIKMAIKIGNKRYKLRHD